MKNLFPFALVLLLSCSEPQEVVFEPEIFAKATLYSLNDLGDNEYDVTESEIGTAEFSQDGDVVMLEIKLSGMTPNTFKAVHIHIGSVESPGRHWNRGSLFASCDSLSLGNFWGRPFIGDVGNVRIDANGDGLFTLRTDLWSINTGDDKDVLNRPIIIHDQPQDFEEECDPNHDHNHLHQNPKIGGGTIVLTSDVPVIARALDYETEVPDFLICK